MRVAILGCGYVGLRLGRELAPEHDVVGVRRSDAGLDSIREAGFEAVRADVTDPAELAEIPDADWLVFAASSGGRGPEAARDVYVEGQRRAIEHFGSRADPSERYVYTSSTGVYGDHGGDWVDESTPIEPTTEKTRVLARAEEVALDAGPVGMTPTVARLAGLYGPDRYRLERYLTGPVTDGYLNMVHGDDAAGALAHCLEQGVAADEILLVVDDEPVDRWAFADWLAEACDEPAPPKQTTAERLEDGDLSAAAERRIRTEKRCSNDKLHAIGYECRFPTFREGYRAAVEAHRGDETGE